MVAIRKEDVRVSVSPKFRVLSESTLKRDMPKAQFKGVNGKPFDFEEYGIKIQANGEGVAEAITTGDISSDFFKRMEYEVEAGRREVPTLYESVYDVMVDGNLPKTIEINTLGTGVTWNLIPDGGEVKWSQVTSSDKTLTLHNYGTGLQYTEDMFVYNQTWLFPGLERDFGNAYNALLNHLHLNPIISASLTGDNATDASAMTAFRATDSLQIKYIWALKQAIADSMDDTSNPRYGPYWLLCHPLDAMTFQQALVSVPQQGVNVQLPQMDGVGMIEGIIGYNGWSGTRGKEATSYSGVTAGTAYLIHVGHKRYDFISRFKHGLQRRNAGSDLTRFIVEKIVWNARFGMYANPGRSVQKITLPGGSDGAS